MNIIYGWLCLPYIVIAIYVIIIAYKNESQISSGFFIAYHSGLILENIHFLDKSCQHFILSLNCVNI